MFQKTDDVFKTSYETIVPGSIEELIGALKTTKADSAWYSFLLPEQIDPAGIAVNGHVIEITRSSTPLRPFIAYGKITLYLQETRRQDRTRIRCEIHSGNRAIVYFLAGMFLACSLMSVFFFITATHWTNKVTGAALFFIIPALASYVKYRYARRELIDYSRAVIKMMRS